MEWLRYGCAVLRLHTFPVAITDSEAVMSTIREAGLAGEKSGAHCLGDWDSVGRCWKRMGRSPLVWQLSSPSPFYSPPSPRRVFSDRVKTLSNCLTRSCSLLRVRQKGQRGPERDDERGRDEGRGRGLEQGMPTELSHAAIRGLLTQHHWSRTETNVVEKKWS